MILELLISMLVGLVEALAGLLGSAPAPGWLTGLSGQLSSLVGAGASLGVWVPWSVIGTVLAAIGACLGISLGVRVFRIVLSLFTGGGGGAA